MQEGSTLPQLHFGLVFMPSLNRSSFLARLSFWVVPFCCVGVYAAITYRDLFSFSIAMTALGILITIQCLGFMLAQFLTPAIVHRQENRLCWLAALLGVSCLLLWLLIARILNLLPSRVFVHSVGAWGLSSILSLVVLTLSRYIGVITANSPHGCCSNCGYNLRGLKMNRCPECGCATKPVKGGLP